MKAKNSIRVFIIGASAVFLTGCFHVVQTNVNTGSTNDTLMEVKDEFQITDIVLGTGAAAENGDRVEVHYTGTLKDGTKFDSSFERNQSFTFVLGAGTVIRGWDLGVLGMKVGGKRKLVIPPELGYGANQVGIISSNSTLLFEVELLGIEGKESAIMKKEDETVEGDDVSVETILFSGTVLAGIRAKLIDFNTADYETALNSDKLVVLYFYADWCPICKAEVPKLYAAFNELNSDAVVGFRVNYNDNFTDTNEENLAREHGVAYQHTKVFIKNRQRILKSPESWDKARYLSEIQKNISE